jgi:hypothetical protein
LSLEVDAPVGLGETEPVDVEFDEEEEDEFAANSDKSWFADRPP